MTDAPPPLPPPPRPACALRVVGLGASAGGLEALEQFLGRVAPGSGCAYLVVQHLDPTHDTRLHELLQRACVLPVQQAENGHRIEADAVYVIPPDAEMTLDGGALHLAPPPARRGLRLPIDALFHSLAAQCGACAVGVVLSGMGADGAQGLQAIREHGGLALVQLPASARFDSMPRSAIAAGAVDVVAAPADLPARIAAAAPAADAPPAPAAPVSEDMALRRILVLLREHHRHDLGHYKKSTLMRRVSRRLAVHGLPTMAAYAELLRDNLQERALLFKELLIGVTAFFRDPPAWKALQREVLPGLVARRAAQGGPLRAWVVGCSTGEEAYTLAIACTELIESLPAPERCELQVFATDLNADAIVAARTGIYPATITRDLSPERLARFFSARSGGRWQVDPPIRDRVLFAVHDVTQDPPFTRLDLVCCRNLLIYFDAALQKRLVPLLHFSLRPGGALLLGSADSVGRVPELFQPLDAPSRLYWRGDNGGTPSPLVFPTARRPAALPTVAEPPLSPSDAAMPNVQPLADQLLLQSFAPPAVLVTAAGDILYVNGRTGRYLEPAAGKANWNLHVMARPSLRAELGLALRQALQAAGTVELRALPLDEEGPSAATVDITVQAVLRPKALEGTLLVVFRETAAEPGRRRRRARQPGAPEPALAEELQRSRQDLQDLRLAMRLSQEELQAANEELQSTNEELQAANEELSTSKEEAQSMIEELQTINGELQSKLDDLALAQSDMQNLLNSTDIATLFLDAEGNVRRYTEQIARVIPLRETDIGRPLGELATALLYPELQADVQQTLRTLAFSEKQITTQDGRWFNVRVMPYRTGAHVVQGVVITFVDITMAKELEARLRKA